MWYYMAEYAWYGNVLTVQKKITKKQNISYDHIYVYMYTKKKGHEKF